jgi:hypothetical protein
MENTKNNDSDHFDTSDDEDLYTFDNIDFDDVERVYNRNSGNIENSHRDADSGSVIIGTSDNGSSSEESEEESLIGRAVNYHNDTDSESDIIPPKRRRSAYLSDDSDEEDIRPSTPINPDTTNPTPVNPTTPCNSTKTWYSLSTIISPKKINFSIGNRIVGPNIPTNCLEPIDYFQLFFTSSLISKIVEETNKYATSKIKRINPGNNSMWNSWENVGDEEFKAFLGVILNMGIRPHPSLQDYFSTAFTAYSPFFRSIFKRERFLQIYWMLHLHDNQGINREDGSLQNRINKVDMYMKHLDERFREHFFPGREIVVDESVVNFKGKICFMTYNPNKPTKWGIRLYVLADSSCGYIYSFIPYYGSLTTEKLIRPDLQFTSRIVLQLYTNLLETIPEAEGYHMYTDRFYTSLPLSDELLKLKTHLTGTIMTNRKNLPTAIKKPKLKQSEVLSYGSDDTMVLAWRDKRVVTMLSNWHSNETRVVNRIKRGGIEEEIVKPEVVIDYTKYMGGVDRADHYTSTYCFLRKTLKWWRKLFFWGLEVSVVNSYILYKENKNKNNEKPLSHLQFVDKLINQLVGNHREGLKTRRGRHSIDPEQRLNHINLHVIMPDIQKKYRDCVVCGTNRKENQRKRTMYYCKTCDNKPALHVGECFEKYHTLKKYSD